MTNQSEKILELQNVNKIFNDGKGKKVHAVNNLSLSLGAGECLALVGGSGSGKSTVARLISHLIPVTNGKIIKRGKNITNLHYKKLKEYYRKVQMIFQNPLDTFSPKMKIGAYLIEPFINFKICSKTEALEIAKKSLESVGLDADFINRFPFELSGGQLQRVVIARAISLEPEIIIFDEATSALDVTIQKQIIELLNNLQKKHNYTSIFITHDLALAEALAQHIYVMKDGEIVEILCEEDGFMGAEHSYTKQLIDSVF